MSLANNFYWGDMDDIEIEKLNSDLFSIHEMMNKLAPNHNDQSHLQFCAHNCTYDTDTTSTEIQSLEEACHRKVSFLEEFILPENPSFPLSMHPVSALLEKEENKTKEGNCRRSLRKRKSTVVESEEEEEPATKAEEELNEFIQSATDPVGKFLRKLNISAREAVKLNIHRMLLSCPRKVREKYGPRKELDEDERISTNRERNREHARATRLRRKIFKQVEEVLAESGYGKE